MPRHVAVFVQALALLSAGALAIPVYSGLEDDDTSWEDVFGRAAADDDYGDVQQLAVVGPECDYGVGVVGEDIEDVLAVGVLVGDPGTREVYDDEEEEDGTNAADTFELGDNASYADVYSKLVSWLLQVDREQAREDAERMAASFLNDLTA